MNRTRELRVLLDLARALLSSRPARIRFRDTARRTSERIVDVLALGFDPPRWIAAAWSAELGSLRLLDVSRVRSVRKARRRTAGLPTGFDPQHFATRRWFDARAPASVRTIPATLAPPWSGVAEALLPGARVVRDGAGNASVRVRASRPDVVASLVASLADGCDRLTVRAMPSASERPGHRPKPYEERLLRLAAWILETDAPVTRDEIYARFSAHYRGKDDTKERMFTRDKDALRRLGFNLESEEVGGEEQVGYTIDAHGSMLQPIELTPEEAAAAWTAGLGALRLSAHPMRDELEGALRKLVVGTRSLPPRAAATEELPSDGGDDGDALLAKLGDAWERRRRVHLGYWRVASGEVVARDVDVYGWARRRGEWIFVGHCHLRGGVRIFYLSRVRSLALAKLPKDEAKARARRKLKGDYDIPADFDIRRWSRQQIWDYDVHDPVAATVRFRGSLAGIARQLVPGAQVSSDGEGGSVARVEVRNLRGLVRQALAWGPDAEVTAPPEARALARDILAATVPTPRRGTP